MVTGKQQENKVRQWVLDAEERSRKYINETPLEYSLHLSKLTSAEVYLKLDLMQKTSSFKFRGAVSKITNIMNERQKNESSITCIDPLHLHVIAMHIVGGAGL